MLHGISDDFVEIAPCRSYLERLQKSAKDVKMIEFPDTWHIFDIPHVPPTPTISKNAQTTHCALQEEPLGTIINLQTRMPFTDSDSCVGRNPHVAYSATSTHAAEDAIKALLKTVFKLN